MTARLDSRAIRTRRWPGRLAVALAVILLCRGVAGAVDLDPDPALWPPQVFKSAYRLIATAEEARTLDTIAPEALGRYLKFFWKRRDPTPATAFNEFEKQFRDRVETALTRFATQARPAPWDQRGEAYIRFGPPDDIVDSSFDAYYEKWYYFDRNLKLMFEGSDLEYDLVPFVEFTGEVQALPDFAEDRKEVQSTRAEYVLPPGQERIDLALDWYPFRRADGRYDVYVACAVPLHAIARPLAGRGGDVEYRVRVIAFDSTLQSRWNDSAAVSEHFARIPRGGMAQNEWQTLLDPGLYVVAAEVQDSRGKKHAADASDRWLVPFQDSVQLDLSALVVAADVRPATDSSGPFVRNGKEIIPMPGHVFNDDQDIAFYHEVYNLTPDSTGHCHYQIEYALYDAAHKERRTLVSQELTSTQRETFQAGKIAHDKVSPGRYILEVTTRDLVDGQNKTALAGLTVE
jgi:GWxTD domain-containing protein